MCAYSFFRSLKCLSLFLFFVFICNMFVSLTRMNWFIFTGHNHKRCDTFSHTYRVRSKWYPLKSHGHTKDLGYSVSFAFMHHSQTLDSWLLLFCRVIISGSGRCSHLIHCVFCYNKWIFQINRGKKRNDEVADSFWTVATNARSNTALIQFNSENRFTMRNIPTD